VRPSSAGAGHARESIPSHSPDGPFPPMPSLNEGAMPPHTPPIFGGNAPKNENKILDITQILR